jgi:predicted metal-dependent enzyme (double-stranded beta helix superfamily)
MENAITKLIEKCHLALDDADPQSSVEGVLRRAVNDPDIAAEVAQRTKFANLADLAVHRSEQLTLLAGALPPGFAAAPHNHNLWSVVGVCSGQEDNEYFERDGDRLKPAGKATVVGPDVLPNAADVIHAIRNPLDVPLLVVHAYGGDLFAVERSTWDPKTHEEIPFDWQKVRSSQKT